MRGNIGDLFVKNMYVTSRKRAFVPSVGGVGLLCIGSGHSQFCETSPKVTNA